MRPQPSEAAPASSPPLLVLSPLPGAGAGPDRVVFVTNALPRRVGPPPRSARSHRPVVAVVVR